MTRYALNGARSDVLGKPECARSATWDSWSCTAMARATAGPYAGLALTYRCRALARAPTGGRVPTRVTLCGPKNPPSLTGVPSPPG